ncbi:MAG: mechanosensitive ion channel family protein [Bacillota bacterium]
MEGFLEQVQLVLTVDMVYRYSLKLIGIILVLIAGRIGIGLAHKFIDRMVEDYKDKYTNPRRVRTLQMLLKSVLKYLVYFFAAMIVLSMMNVPITSLLAGAGVLGVALGFGAQTLVKDVINGFFILFEDQFAVDDYIQAAGIDGTVEQIGLRTTNIRSFGGELHIVPNSQITQVTNYSDGNMRVMVDIGVSYDENPGQVIEVLEELCGQIAEEKGDIITDGPRVLGVQDLGDSSVVFRIWAKTQPMKQWEMGRYIKQRVKEKLDETGINIPYPHVVVVSNNKQKVIADEQ